MVRSYSLDLPQEGTLKRKNFDRLVDSICGSAAKKT
jgi:hypothetical protein